MGAGADHDRVDEAGEDAAGVADRLAAGELHFVAAEDDRVGAELDDADLEGDPGPGRGLLEDEGDAAPRERLGAEALATVGLQRGGTIEQLAQLEGAQLFSRQEVSLLQAAHTTAVEFTAVGWNLFHGRDFPPDPALITWRSRLLRIEERNETHVQVNRDLAAEFATLLADAKWDVALLQECPPRFAAPLARACEAEAHRVLTSRNSLSALRAAAARVNPDLVASSEGGSNLTLVRNPFRCALSPYDGEKAHRNSGIVERRELAIHEGWPERRAMAFTRIAIGEDAYLCVANLHATNDRPELATTDVLLAAEAAVGWAGDSPLLFGGDLNLRPGEDPGIFEELERRFDLTGATGPRAIDHLLSRGLNVIAPAAPWPAERREPRRDGRALRLSDHSPVQASFAAPRPQARQEGKDEIVSREARANDRPGGE
jgi:endonuclease/exonuclease/phosphatase family metal-dependent hydrolase